jgi:hypothetical protein
LKLGTQKPGITTPFSSSERKVASSNVNGVFLDDGTAKCLRCFCTHHEMLFLSFTLWVPDWEVFGPG